MDSSLKVLSQSGEPWLPVRTLRSFAGLRVPPGAFLLARAGSWLLEPVSGELPPGDGFIGVGFDRSPASLALLRSTGGEFGHRRGWFSRFRELPPACYFPPEVAVQLEEDDLEGSAWRLLRRGRCRVVHLPQLTVHRDPRLRVAQIVTTLQIGGAEKIALNLASELNDLGVPTLLVSLGRGNRTELPPVFPFLDLSASGNRCADLELAARCFGADLLHAHLLSGEQIQQLAAAGWPVVTTLHNTSQAWPRGTESLTGEHLRLVVACSQAVEQQVRLPVVCRTVWNGISQPPTEGAELRAAYGVGEGDLVLGALANVRPQKGFEVLGEILQAVQQRVPERRCHLWVAGQGTETLGWPAGVRSFGLVEDPVSWLRSVDVLLSPSRHEGLSLVHLEAIALGKQVVATRVGGAAEVPGVTVVPALSAPGDFAAAVIDSLSRPTPRLSPSFLKPAMARRTVHLYRRALAGKPRAPRGLWLIANNFSTGGAQTSARRLLGELQRRGMCVRAAVVEESAARPTPGRLSLERAGVRVWAPGRSVLGEPEAICEALLQELDQDPPEAVFFWNLLPSCKLILADALLHTRVYDVSPGEMNFDSLDRYFAKPRTGLPYLKPSDYGRRLAAAVVKYDGERQRAEQTLGCRVEVIPNGVEVELRPQRHLRGPLQFVTVARLSPDKCLEQLLEAFRIAGARLPQGCRLHVAGGVDGDRTQYARGLRKVGRGLPVVWHGELRDVRPLLQRCDVFVMISEPAGCPNASLEAMACGLPVVATDHGGAREQVEEGVSGYLVPRGHVQSLADRMVHLASNPALLDRLGEGAQQRIRTHFSLGAMADSYARLIAAESHLHPKNLR